MSTETLETPVEILDSSALGQIERAQIDMQIATARRYPRSLSHVKSRMLSFATLDEETAAGCFYTLPGRKGGDGKPIQGPSVRLAEIAISSYQHIRAGSRIVEDDGKFITAQGVVHDLENNVVIAIEVKRRVTTKKGERYSDDMIATTGNAACSIALRNAAFRVIPLALVKPVYEAAKKLAIGDAKSLVQRRAASIDHFAKLGVPKEKVCAAIGVRAVEDIQLEHLEILIGYATAIKDGDATVDEVFNRQAEEKEKRQPENPFKPEAPEPAEPEPAPSPVEPDSAAAWLDRIENLCMERDPLMSLADFEEICRKTGEIGKGAFLERQSVTRLQKLHDTFAEIVAKEGGAA